MQPTPRTAALPFARPLCLAATVVALIGAAWSGAAHAQDVRLYGAGEMVDPADVARILAPAPAPELPRLGKSRSLRLLDDTPSAPVARNDANVAPTSVLQNVAAAVPAAAPSQALALPVQFAFDSAEILPAARAQLDALAAGIRMVPLSQGVVIEGHTDARGTEAYNAQLSEKRAFAVKRYLVMAGGIDAARLRVIGEGKAQPLPGRDPMAPENRRVQFRGEALSSAVATTAAVRAE